MIYTEPIEKENWRKAPGVRSRGRTNSALALRDYSIKCETKYRIIYIKGYHRLWCSTHHQPHYQCKLDLAEDKFLVFTQLMKGKMCKRKK